MFTKIDVTKGSILCIQRGIIVNPSFWKFSDYSTTNMRIVNGQKYILDRNPGMYYGYADYIKDSLDPERVNVELVEYVKDGFVVVKCTKDIKALNEIISSFWQGLLACTIPISMG